MTNTTNTEAFDFLTYTDEFGVERYVLNDQPVSYYV